ncbi:hypothetical protein CPB86DRAFT_778046 [Serendipita vermifera]|nr:hypothetical protein CPB86DRAFT_778046 [Serendipita vermifera]
MVSGIACSLENFMDDNPNYEEFYDYLSKTNPARRGLPAPKKPSYYADAIRTLFVRGSIPREAETSPEILSKFEEAYNCGFINLDQNEEYTFPSPIFQQIWEWHLTPLANCTLPYSDIFSFVKATAQYQKEFYRSVQELTKGNIRTLPEYTASTKSRLGRIDFFIPSKKWGIELIRNGDDLIEHDSRFGQSGACGNWLRTSKMTDYVLLDFRKKKPSKQYPGIKNLYHVVIDSEGYQYEIYDNKLVSQTRGNLLQRPQFLTGEKES